jgi:hypothetical protein
MMLIASRVVMPEITALTQRTYWFPPYIDYEELWEVQQLYCDDESLPTDMNPSALPAEWSQFNDEDIPF